MAHPPERNCDMRIKVEQRHIEAGKRRDVRKCPVALALNEATGLEWMVADCLSSLDGGIHRSAPPSVIDFFSRFDEEMPVQPFEFKLNNGIDDE